MGEGTLGGWPSLGKGERRLVLLSLSFFFWLPRKITIAVIGGAGNGAQVQYLGLIVPSAPPSISGQGSLCSVVRWG